MKAIHKNLGEVEIIGADVNGITKVRTSDGNEVDASTPYLKPIPEPTIEPS
jgi:hypothetical protein